MNKKCIIFLALSMLLVACGPSQEDINNMLATALKSTEAARPTDTPAPTDTPSPTDTPIPSPTEEKIYTVLVQVKSEIVLSLDNDVWLIEWGKNGSMSSYEYKSWDLEGGDFEKGYGLRWEERLIAKSGDVITIVLTGKSADCVIVVDNKPVIKASIAGYEGKAVCEYELP